MNNAIARRIIATLLAGQSLGVLGITAAYTLGAIAVERITGQPALAGLPSMVYLLGSALGAYPAGRFMDRFGRRSGLTVGFAIAVLGALAAAVGVSANSFAGLLVGFALIGLGQGALNLARFAAAEVVPTAERARAVSAVVFAGTLGGVAGPLIIGPTSRLAGQFNFEPLAGPYLMAGVLLVVGGLVIALLLRPDPREVGKKLAAAQTTAAGELDARPRSFAKVLKLTSAQVAVAAMVLGQFVMIVVMTMTPLEVNHQTHNLDAVSWVIAAHILGMYGLSMITGRVADMYGRGRAIVAGAFILIAACVLAPLAQGLLLLAAALFLLGLGWNFCYVAGSSLLADQLRPNERGRVQGANDLLLALTSAGASLGSGLIFASAMFTGIALVGLATALLLLMFYAWTRVQNAKADALASG